jgi:hypothetical protein
MTRDVVPETFDIEVERAFFPPILFEVTRHVYTQAECHMDT